MKSRHERNLRKKGWSHEEIVKAKLKMSYAESKKKSKQKFFDKIIFWLILFGAIIGNMLLSLVMIPIVMVSGKWFAYCFSGGLALLFGFLFVFLIRNLEQIDHRHHIITGIIIPVLAIINIHISTQIGNRFIGVFELIAVEKSPIVMGLIFGVVFMIPFIFFLYEEYFR